MSPEWTPDSGLATLYRPLFIKIDFTNIIDISLMHTKVSGQKYEI